MYKLRGTAGVVLTSMEHLQAYMAALTSFVHDRLEKNAFLESIVSEF
eukprot:SAG31_NODE_532_length_14374_cov_30.565254_15_plen_47_part_00